MKTKTKLLYIWKKYIEVFIMFNPFFWFWFMFAYMTTKPEHEPEPNIIWKKVLKRLDEYGELIENDT